MGIAAESTPKRAINLGQSLSQPAADSSLYTREPLGTGDADCRVGPAGLLAMTMVFSHSEERSDVGIRPFYDGQGFGPPRSSAPTKKRDSCRNHPSQRAQRSVCAAVTRSKRESAQRPSKRGSPPRPPRQRLAKRKARKEQLVKFDLCPIPSECSTAQKVRKSDKSPARAPVGAASIEQNSLEPHPAARQGASRARNCAATSVFSFDGSTAVFFLGRQKENGGGLMPGIPGNPGFYFVKRLRKPVEVRKRISMTAGTM